MSEILNPRWKDISAIFHSEFSGMTFEHVTLDELQAVPEAMINSLKLQFTQADFDFLHSFKSGTPNWSLAPHEKIQHLPAVQWKLHNINSMPAERRATALTVLEKTMHSWLSE